MMFPFLLFGVAHTCSSLKFCFKCERSFVNILHFSQPSFMNSQTCCKCMTMSLKTFYNTVKHAADLYLLPLKSQGPFALEIKYFLCVSGASYYNDGLTTFCKKSLIDMNVGRFHTFTKKIVFLSDLHLVLHFSDKFLHPNISKRPDQIQSFANSPKCGQSIDSSFSPFSSNASTSSSVNNNFMPSGENSSALDSPSSTYFSGMRHQRGGGGDFHAGVCSKSEETKLRDYICQLKSARSSLSLVEVESVEDGNQNSLDSRRSSKSRDMEVCFVYKS